MSTEAIGEVQENSPQEIKYISLLGSTGSIGTQTLDIVRANPGMFRVVALAAKSNAAALADQVIEFRPKIVSVGDDSKAEELSRLLREKGCENEPEIVCGEEGLKAAATAPGASLVVNAVVGAAGLLPTLAAVECGKDVALANKETLVAGGEIVTRLVAEKGTRLLPVDSEHSALAQCLVGEDLGSVRRLILTASGGPFRTRMDLSGVRPEEALRHPNWSMGPKITVDSATLMNKALEVIEARWLFGIPGDRISVVVHPESIVHSMVEFVDGSIKAQLGAPDMRVPIQYALTYPSRAGAHWTEFDILKAGRLNFEAPDLVRFPGLGLAWRALEEGGTTPAVLNAANEAAVYAFLEGSIGFLDIPRLVTAAMDSHATVGAPALADILEADAWARQFVLERLRSV